MSGFFGVVSKKDCVFDLFFGTDYHSHLGTRRGGMAVYGEGGFNRAIHNIENSPFRTKFERDFDEMKGNIGIGCISDSEPQPLLVRSHLGNFAISTVGRINNLEELVKKAFSEGATHFLEMSGGNINATELVASLINRGTSIPEGIKIAQDAIDGSMSILILTSKGIYVSRDKHGKTPSSSAKKRDPSAYLSNRLLSSISDTNFTGNSAPARSILLRRRASTSSARPAARRTSAPSSGYITETLPPSTRG